MLRLFVRSLVIVALAVSGHFHDSALAQANPARIALVIGNADYPEGPLATAANDAGLVAESLRGAGFDVTGAANLDQDALRRAFRDFLARAAQAGPRGIAFVYLSGRGLQYEGENYFAPIGAAIQRDSDVPIEAVRISDFTRALGALPLAARIVALDAARANMFASAGQPLAGGLALVEADPGALYAFNAAPGTIAPDEPPPYGAYARALAEMLREGGISIDEIFARARLRVNETAKGAFVPWHVSNITPPLILTPGAPSTPALALQRSGGSRSRPIGEFPSVAEAYTAAIDRDTFGGYQEFLAVYPDDPLAARVRALLAARREALTWRRAVEANAPNAYWTYMRRYPRGPHYADARRRLIYLSAPLEPPPRFDVYDFGGLPPPPQFEYGIVDRPVVFFGGDAFPPPPPPPVYFLPPPPVVFVELPPPPPPPQFGFLPIPIPIPFPVDRPVPQPGVVVQPNFGQQGPIGASINGGQGFGGQRGSTAPATLQPAQVQPAQVQPAQVQPAQVQPAQVQPSNPALPASSAPAVAAPPPAGPHPGAPTVVAPSAGPNAAPPKVAPSQVAPAQVAPPQPAPGQIAPSHALPQGKQLPLQAPAGAQTSPPSAPSTAAPPAGAHPGGPAVIAPSAAPANAPAQVAPAQVAPTQPPPAQIAPNHALPQGKELPSQAPAGAQAPKPAGVQTSPPSSAPSAPLKKVPVAAPQNHPAQLPVGSEPSAPQHAAPPRVKAAPPSPPPHAAPPPPPHVAPPPPPHAAPPPPPHAAPPPPPHVAPPPAPHVAPPPAPHVAPPPAPHVAPPPPHAAPPAKAPPPPAKTPPPTQ